MNSSRYYRLALIITTVFSLQAMSGPNPKDIQAIIADVQSGSPFARQIQIATEAQQVRSLARTARSELASTIAQALQDVQSIRDARATQLPLLSDKVSALDPDFNKVVQLAMLCRNHLMFLPDNKKKEQPYPFMLQPYRYIDQATGKERAIRDDALDLQLYTFDLTARLRKLKKDLNASTVDIEQIKQDYNAFKKQADAMRNLALNATNTLSQKIRTKIITPMTDDVTKAQRAMEAVARGEQDIEKAQRDAEIAGQFIGMFGQVAGQAIGTAASKDPFLGQTIGAVSREFGTTVTSLIAGPIIEAKARKIHDDIQKEFGAYSKFNSQELALAHYYMGLALQLFTDQWCSLWDTKVGQLAQNSSIYGATLEGIVKSIIRNPSIAPVAATIPTASLVNRSFLRVNTRLQDILLNLQTVQEISAYNQGQEVPILVETEALNTLLDNIDILKSAQETLRYLMSNVSSIASIMQSATFSDPQTQRSLNAYINAIESTLSDDGLNKLKEDLDKTYILILQSFNDPRLNIHDLVVKEIKDANDAMLTASVLVTGGVENNAIIMMLADSLDQTTANQWAVDMQRKHSTDYSSMNTAGLSMLVQDVYSISDDDIATRKELMIKKYPKYAMLALHGQHMEELSVLLHNTYNLLLTITGPTVITTYTPNPTENNYTVIKPLTELTSAEISKQTIAEFNGLQDALKKFTSDARRYLLPANSPDPIFGMGNVTFNTKEDSSKQIVQELLELLDSVVVKGLNHYK